MTLAEELHFGRAAVREDIVRSAPSRQVQRLERELGVRLLDRSTHHVDLTPAGAAFLIEARQVLDHVGRAGQAARDAATSAPRLRAGIIDLVLQHRCVHRVPSFQTSNRPGTTWRPLIEPATHYPVLEFGPGLARAGRLPDRLLTVWLAALRTRCHAGLRIRVPGYQRRR